MAQWYVFCKTSPSHKEHFLSSSKLTMWFWRKRFLKSLSPIDHKFHGHGGNWLNDSKKEDFKISSMYFPYFLIISLGKEHGPLFEQFIFNSLHPMILFAKFNWNWLNLGKQMTMWKVYRQMDGRTDGLLDGQTTGDQKGSLEL